MAVDESKLSKEQKDALAAHQDLAAELASVRQKLATSKKKLVQMDISPAMLVASL
jgi:hypothetical protein